MTDLREKIALDLISIYPCPTWVEALRKADSIIANVLNEAASVADHWPMPTIQTPSMWLIDKAGIVAEILAIADRRTP